MRPVRKGDNHKTFAEYQEAKRDLVDAIGRYCSYCERRLEYSGAVEHVMPKSLHGENTLKWDNFLLACTNCNSHKGQKDINEANIDNYVWPDKDDTYHEIDYDEVTAMPKAHNGLSNEEKDKVENTIHLVGLDVPSTKIGDIDYDKMTDTRAEDRLACMIMAKEYFEDYLHTEDNYKEREISLLKKLVEHCGYWSVWMHEFEKDPRLK